MRISSALCVILAGMATTVMGDPGTLTVAVDKPGAAISPMLYGLMTEEINHSYDGGLYAELIQNRIFKDSPTQPAHWSVVQSNGAAGGIALDQSDPVNKIALTTSLRLDITAVGANQRVGVTNDGYWGIPVWPKTQYRASFYAKSSADFSGPLNVSIDSADGQTVFASASVPAITPMWKKYDVTLTTGDVPTSADNRFVISAASKGSIWFNLVSLFPPTFNDRPNGNRIDLMQLLGGLQPAFLRFPGGNYLEGDTVAERFNWLTTIGPLEDRPGHQGPWRYRSSDGLGLLEFLEWCEDLKMEPVLAVYAGYSLRHVHVNPGADLEPFVQEDLNEIEYCIGDQSTKWGQQRAKDGHPEPFTIHYVEIGNEDWFDRAGYEGRFAQIFDAIRAKYPQLKLIATAPVRSRRADVVDDHYYHSPRQMEQLAHRYDNASRNGPKIFVGEWASQEGKPTPDLNSALGDAAFLTGLERNCDLVIMSCYAPLLVNVNRGASQWGTNLIGYNAIASFGSPSYYAQKMFSQNRGDVMLPVQIEGISTPPDDTPAPHGAVGVGTWDTHAEFKDIKVTAGDKVLYQTDFSHGSDDWKLGEGDWKVTDGAIEQTSDRENCTAAVGDPNWTDYTYNVKARKIDGGEGFLILFHLRDSGNYFWWNIGGWGNTRSQLEISRNGAREAFGPSANFTIEPDKWYDLRIEVAGRQIKCYADDKLITEATIQSNPPVAPLYATASRVNVGGDVILKVVNVTGNSQPMDIELQGVGAVGKSATVQVLSGQPTDVNSVDAPEKIVPQRQDISDAAASFSHEFPPYSVTVMRLSAK